MNNQTLNKYIGMSMGVIASFMAVALVSLEEKMTPFELFLMAGVGVIAYVLLNRINPEEE